MGFSGSATGDQGLGDVMWRIVAAQMQAVRGLALRLGHPDPFGATEGERLASIRAQAVPPERCGPDMPIAPARGEVVAFAPMAMQPSGQEGYELQHAGWRGRDALRAADAFDRMEAQSRRAGARSSLFHAGQIAQGRAYAALVERHAARGVRCVSVETMLAGRTGGAGGSFADALLSESALIDRLRAAIGDGVALEVQRVRRQGRRSVTVRALVDAVCIEGLTITAVLARHGWPDRGETLAAARSALAAALDRMIVS